MKTSNRMELSVAFLGFVALSILFVVSSCTLEDGTTPTQKSTTVITTIVARITHTASATSRIQTSPEYPIETPLSTTNVPVQNSNDQLLGKNMVAIIELDGTNIHLLDLDTGLMRMLLLPPEYHPIRVLAWSNNGCEISVVSRGRNGALNAILLVDLWGNIAQYLLFEEHMNNIRNIVLSPSQEWIAYRLSEGEYIGGYDPIYEFENIEVISVGGDMGPYRLTQGNGGREVAWAPDSTRLAYGDFDENGVQQLYISNMDGTERIQLTQFDEPLVEIRHVQWSPEGNRIAFAYTRIGNVSSMEPQKTDVMVISAESGDIPIISDRIYLAYKLWWQGDDTLVVWGYEREYGDYNMQNEHLFWIDANSGQVTDILEGDTTPEGYMINPQPLGIPYTIYDWICH